MTQKIIQGKWYKHLHSPAYGRATHVYKRNVRVVYDNGFVQMVDKLTFFNYFMSTPRSDKMSEK